MAKQADGFMQEVLTIDFRRPVAVFPLPDNVLFPHTLLPLHIFEPRYRRMVADALDDVGLVAMGLFEHAVSQDEYLHGSPTLRPWVCVGLIRRYEHLDDGRYFIILQGICRAQIQAEAPHQPYRIATLEPADIAHTEDPALTPLRERLAALVRDPAFEGDQRFRKARQHLHPSRPLRAVVDGMLSDLVADPEERYAMLAETAVSARAHWLIQFMEALRADAT